MRTFEMKKISSATVFKDGQLKRAPGSDVPRDSDPEVERKVCDAVATRGKRWR